MTERQMELLFRRRNDAWIGKVIKEMGSGPVFVAVGLGHLLGKNGLVVQLRKAGYVVRRVP